MRIVLLSLLFLVACSKEVPPAPTNKVVINGIIVKNEFTYKGYCEIEYEYEEEVDDRESYEQPEAGKIVLLECIKVIPGDKIKVTIEYDRALKN